MKIETQGSVEMTRLGQLIENTPVAMLTTRDGDGALVSRPMSPLEMDANGAVWFFTDVRSTKINQLGAVNLTFVDAAKGAYVSLSGRGEIYADHAHTEKLWTEFAKCWFPDGPDSTHLALLKFVPDAADCWDASLGRMVRVLAMTTSVLTGEPIALGEQRTPVAPPLPLQQKSVRR
jgi:general stress protein 26